MTNAAALRMTIPLLLFNVLYATSALGLNEPTHAIVNEQAGRASTLDQILKTQLGFRAGGLPGRD